MKRLFHVLLLFLLTLSVTGCWGHTNISEYNIIYGIGFDLIDDNNYILTTEGISPLQQEENNTTEKPLYYSSIGKSIFDAARNMTKQFSKRTYYQACNTIVLGEKLSKNGLTPVFDFFTRDSKRRSTAYPVIFEDNVQDLFKENDSLPQSLSKELIDIIKLYTFTGYAVNNNLSKTISISKKISGTVLLNKFKFNTLTSNDDANKPILDGTGVVYNNKLIGYFTPQETMVANIISTQIKKAIIVIPIDTKKNQNITLELSDFNTKFKPLIENDNYEVTVDISANSKIVEYSGEESLPTYNYNQLEKLTNEHLKKLIVETFSKCKKELKVDALGLGNSFIKKYKYLSKLKPEEWNDIFSKNFSLKLNVKTNITNIGNTLDKSD